MMKRTSKIQISFILIVIIALLLIALVIFFYDQKVNGIENSMATPGKSNIH